MAIKGTTGRKYAIEFELTYIGYSGENSCDSYLNFQRQPRFLKTKNKLHNFFKLFPDVGQIVQLAYFADIILPSLMIPTLHTQRRVVITTDDKIGTETLLHIE